VWVAKSPALPQGRGQLRAQWLRCAAQDRSGPHRQRRAEPVGQSRGVAGRGAAGPFECFEEVVEIQLAGAHGDEVSGRPPNDPFGAEQLA